MKILYLGYFSKLNIDERFCSLAANNVCSYVKTTLCKKYDGDVVIINLAQGKKHFSFCKSNKSTNGNVTIIDAPRYGSGRLLSRFSNLMLRKWVRKFIKRNLEDNDQILIYHSLNTLKLERYIARKYNSVLQVEEIYCDVVAKSRKTKRIELESINSFSKHLFVSKSLMNDSRIKSLNSTIFYGSYSLPEVPNVNRLNKSIVYAGTFEKNKGVDFACDLMEILPDYTLYVYGHGSASRKEELLSKYGKKKI
jgi:glycosyltransferase involved in cell wall biosynthesis